MSLREYYATLKKILLKDFIMAQQILMVYSILQKQDTQLQVY